MKRLTSAPLLQRQHWYHLFLNMSVLPDSLCLYILRRQVSGYVRAWWRARSVVCAFEEAQPLKHFVEVPWCQCFGQWSERGARYLWRRCQEKLQDVCPKATPVCQADGNCRATAFVQWDIALMLQNPGQEITQILENCSSIFNASFWPRDILEISVMRQRDGESKHRFEKKNVQPTPLPPT